MGCLLLFLGLAFFGSTRVFRAIQTGIIGTRFGYRSRQDQPAAFRSELIFQLCGVGLCWALVLHGLLTSHLSVQFTS